jgi:hypothetical protein
MKFVLIAVLAAFTLAATTGCATLNNLTNTQVVIANQVLTLGAEVYIQKAAGTAVPPLLYSTQQQARAQKLADFATEVNGFASGSITLAQLDSAMTAWAMKLSTPLEQGAAQALIAEVNVLLATRVSSGVLNAAATALVSEVTNDWIAAARAYGATPTPAVVAKAATRRAQHK